MIFPGLRVGVSPGNKQAGSVSHEIEAHLRLKVFIRSACIRAVVADLVRSGLSLERDLLKKFDETIAGRGYQNRSEAVRDLIREHLVRKRVSSPVLSPFRPTRRCWRPGAFIWITTTAWKSSS